MVLTRILGNDPEHQGLRVLGKGNCTGAIKEGFVVEEIFGTNLRGKGLNRRKSGLMVIEEEADIRTKFGGKQASGEFERSARYVECKLFWT